MKITEDVYKLDSTSWNYAYLILGDEIVLIDTGRLGQGKNILKEIKSMNIRPEELKHILITHHDVDHVGNLALLEKATGAEIWAPKEDIPYIYSEKNRPGIKRIISLFMKVKKPQNINVYGENQKIGAIHVIPTPGHTPGHVCLLYKDVLFVGDLVRTSKGKLGTMRSSSTWDETLLKESIKKISDYDFEWICTAHGEPIRRDEQWEEFIKDLGKNEHS
ncbi:MAG: MBL fold metallo-hydrolase [Methanobacterium sp.]|uniref:MBL fold metallo-hydrolase n=1 Tax=Methanobacterium sp. TaxID=2164 RepID=UPI003D64A781|nr:MBL fold metallo-hydrolase [Methanobacterium sp.]